MLMFYIHMSHECGCACVHSWMYTHSCTHACPPPHTHTHTHRPTNTNTCTHTHCLPTKRILSVMLTQAYLQYIYFYIILINILTTSTPRCNIHGSLYLPTNMYVRTYVLCIFVCVEIGPCSLTEVSMVVFLDNIHTCPILQSCHRLHPNSLLTAVVVPRE